MRVRADPIILVFASGVEYGFLCVYSVMWELFEGMYLTIVVIVTCFVASVMLFLLIDFFFFKFVHSYCKTCCADFC